MVIEKKAYGDWEKRVYSDGKNVKDVAVRLKIWNIIPKEKNLRPISMDC